MNIGGTFRGTDGDKVNTVPASVTFSIDRRITPNEELEFAELELREAISGACEYYSDLNAEARAILRIEPCLTDTDSPIAQAFANAVRTVRFNQPRFKGTTGFTDLHYFVNTGLPGIGYGPSGEGGHAINERVHIPESRQDIRYLCNFHDPRRTIISEQIQCKTEDPHHLMLFRVTPKEQHGYYPKAQSPG